MVRSGILFGPPGTGKTSLVARTSEFLGWPLLSLDPSHFTASGVDQVPTRATEIFTYLSELTDVVILFDEMEEFIRDRAANPDTSKDSSNETNKTELVQRLWTTVFLPKFQALHNSASTLVFVATNFVSGLDRAIIRPGRFDFLEYVGVPNGEDKVEKVRSLLRASLVAPRFFDLVEGICDELMHNYATKTSSADGEIHQCSSECEPSIRSVIDLDEASISQSEKSVCPRVWFTWLSIGDLHRFASLMSSATRKLLDDDKVDFGQGTTRSDLLSVLVTSSSCQIVPNRYVWNDPKSLKNPWDGVDDIRESVRGRRPSLRTLSSGVPAGRRT